MSRIGGTVIEQLPGLTKPLRRLSTGFVVQEIDWRDDPAHTEEWADREAAKYGGRRSRWWQQNMERVVSPGGIPVWPMMADEVHLRRIPFADLMNESVWTLYRSLDHGLRHPTCCAWVAVAHETGDRYFYRQYYATEETIGSNCRHILAATDRRERIVQTVADPSIWQRQPRDLTLLADEYAKNGLPLMQADNSRDGYDVVMRGLYSALARWSVFHGRVHPAMDAPTLTGADLEVLAQAPAIWFHPCCAGGRYTLYDECKALRWKDARGDAEKVAESEEMQDKDDEGADVVRYAVQTPGVVWRQPQPRETPLDWVEAQRRERKRKLKGGSPLD